MIEYYISEKQIKEANKRYEFGELRGSITKGKSNIYGALGEIVVRDYFANKGLNVIDKPTFDYDLIIESYRVDVKSKKIKTPPEDYYICSISNYNTKQNCDFYFFVRINKEEKIAYLLGYMKKGDYFKKAYFKKKGELDETCYFEWRFKDDCWNMKIGDLHKFKK